MEQLQHTTGKEVAYLHVCHRKLWLYHNGIRPELENTDVQLGMLIQEESFHREKKEIPIGEYGVLDWADFKDGFIHETKKNLSMQKADCAQVAFYLYILNEHGVSCREGILHYPKQRKNERVVWNPDTKAGVEADLTAITNILSAPIPSVIRVPYCKKCAYEEICYP